YPTNNGSKLRIYNLLRGLAQTHQITLLAFAEQSNTDLVPQLMSICKEVRTVPWREFDPDSLKARFGLLSRMPRSVIDTYSLEMEQQIEQVLEDEDYDLIIASQWSMAGYSSCFRGIPALFEEVEVGLHYQFYTQAKTFQQRLRYGLSWTKHKNYIARLLQDFSACTVVSTEEKKLLNKISPHFNPIEIIPNCIFLDDYQTDTTEAKPNTLIFTGPFSYHANYEAMVWFLGKVYPLILAQVPDVELTITGDSLGKPLPEIDNVNLVGFVDDIQSLITSSWISIVPLQIGGGTRLKILEAMALHTPVVSTTKGAEGLDCKPGENILIADEPIDFANAILTLLKTPNLRNSLVENAYQLVSENYNWSNVMPRFLDLVEMTAKRQSSCN
ncbi:MAG: glycosyltransferase, partial [Anaerolineae bacterium]|nr:glycosyltransferase [Anaerolineae bacterium]